MKYNQTNPIFLTVDETNEITKELDFLGMQIDLLDPNDPMSNEMINTANRRADELLTLLERSYYWTKRQSFTLIQGGKQ